MPPPQQCRAQTAECNCSVDQTRLQHRSAGAFPVLAGSSGITQVHDRCTMLAAGWMWEWEWPCGPVGRRLEAEEPRDGWRSSDSHSHSRWYSGSALALNLNQGCPDAVRILLVKLIIARLFVAGTADATPPDRLVHLLSSTVHSLNVDCINVRRDHLPRLQSNW